MSEMLLVVGGRQTRLFRQIQSPTEADEFRDYFRPTILLLDMRTGSVLRRHDSEDLQLDVTCAEYSHSYRCGYLDGGTLVTCTMSEIVHFDIDRFEVETTWTHELFNDVHHVSREGETTYVASTGIDSVLEFDAPGATPRVHTVSAEASIEPTRDYRAISTKPHHSHPNHVFFLDGTPWVTRFKQRDAVPVHSPQQPGFEVTAERPHDGLLRDDRVFFSSVNGVVSAFDRHTRTLRDTYDLNPHFPNSQIGWCRGLEVADTNLYIGFSSLRRTKFLEHVAFLNRRLKPNLPARIVRYDLESQRPTGEVSFEPSEMALIFSVLRVAS